MGRVITAALRPLNAPGAEIRTYKQLFMPICVGLYAVCRSTRCNGCRRACHGDAAAAIDEADGADRGEQPAGPDRRNRVGAEHTAHHGHDDGREFGKGKRRQPAEIDDGRQQGEEEDDRLGIAEVDGEPGQKQALVLACVVARVELLRGAVHSFPASQSR